MERILVSTEDRRPKTEDGRQSIGRLWGFHRAAITLGARPALHARRDHKFSYSWFGTRIRPV